MLSLICCSRYQEPSTLLQMVLHRLSISCKINARNKMWEEEAGAIVSKRLTSHNYRTIFTTFNRVTTVGAVDGRWTGFRSGKTDRNSVAMNSKNNSHIYREIGVGGKCRIGTAAAVEIPDIDVNYTASHHISLIPEPFRTIFLISGKTEERTAGQHGIGGPHRPLFPAQHRFLTASHQPPPPFTAATAARTP